MDEKKEEIKSPEEYQKDAELAEKEYRESLKTMQEKKEQAEKARKKAITEKKKFIRKIRNNETSKFARKLIAKIPSLNKNLDTLENVKDFERIFDKAVKDIVHALNYQKKNVENVTTDENTELQRELFDNISKLLKEFTGRDKMNENDVKLIFQFLNDQSHKESSYGEQTKVYNFIKSYFEKNNGI